MRISTISFLSFRLNTPITALVQSLKLVAFTILSVTVIIQCNATETVAVDNLRIIISHGPAQAMYATIRNETPEKLTLTKVESPAFAKIEVHKMTHSEDRMRMEKVDNLEIPANSKFQFAPHQYHFMVFEPTQKLVAGETVPITIYFNNKPYQMNALIKESEN